MNSTELTNHGKHFGTPTVKLMLQMSRVRLEEWAQNSRNLTLTFQADINSEISKDPAKTQLSIEKLEEKIYAIKKFLMDFPDHQDPLTTQEVTDLYSKYAPQATYGALKNYFRPTKEDIKQPGWVNPRGPNGVMGYPTSPGEKRKSPPPYAKDVLESMGEHKKMKEGYEKPANNFLYTVLSSQEEETPSSLVEEETQPDPSFHQETIHSPIQESVKPIQRYNLRSRKGK